MPTKKELQDIIEKQQTQIERGKEVVRRKNAKYNGTIDRINLTFPAGTKEEIEKCASFLNKSVNAYCRDLIMEDVKTRLKNQS